MGATPYGMRLYEFFQCFSDSDSDSDIDSKREFFPSKFEEYPVCELCDFFLNVITYLDFFKFQIIKDLFLFISVEE